MAEDDIHRVELQEYSVEVLEDFFADDALVYVSGNNCVYLTEGDPTDFVSPDTYVVRGVAKHRRRVFKVWEEGAAPCFVLEITSRSTERKDRGEKKAIYESLGVEEYFLFDPTRDWVQEQLRGFRLEGTSYISMLAHRGAFESKQLGLTLRVEDGHVRFYSADRKLETRLERANRESLRAKQAETRAKKETARAKKAEAQAQKAEAQAKEEADRAERAERRLAEAEAELRRLARTK